MPMVVFYISGHGFGHASRDVEVINELGRHCRILIRSAVSPALLARTIRVPYDLLPGGQFLVNTLVEDAAPAAISLIVNWPEALRR